MAKEMVLISSSSSKINEPKIASRPTLGGKALERRPASERATLCCLIKPIISFHSFLTIF